MLIGIAEPLHAIDLELRAPSNLTAIPGSASHFNLTWRDNSKDEGGFIVERKREKDSFWVEVGFVPLNHTSYQAGGCEAETKYLFRVRAFKGYVYSLFSNTASGITPMHFKEPQGTVIENSAIRQGEGTAIKTNDGSIQLYFNSFTGRGDKDISRIARKVSRDGGKTWSKIEILFTEGGTSLLHPSVIRFSQGKIGLTYSKMVKGTWRAWKVFRYSTDEGKTWSQEIKVTHGLYEYMTGAHDRFVTLSNGMVVNVVHSLIQNKDATSKGRMFGTDLFGTVDQGLTWFRVNKKSIINLDNPYGIGEYGFYEASLVEYQPRKLAIFGRNATGFLMAAYSSDMGETWSNPIRLGIQQPLAPVRVQMIPGTDKILLVHNSVKDFSSNNGLNDRSVLVAQTSTDGGQTWKNYRQIEYDGIHLFSYPSILIDNHVIHLFYWETTLAKNGHGKKVDMAQQIIPIEEFEH